VTFRDRAIILEETTVFDPAIPEDLQLMARNELEPGEFIEWSGQPDPVLFTPASIGVSVFGIPFTAFAVFWIWSASQFRPAGFVTPFDLFPLFGIPFVLVGVVMLTMPFWARRAALKTIYVITDRRAITIDGLWTRTIRSYPPERLNDLYRRDHRDGTGDVIISRREWRDSDGDRRSEELGFLRISDAKDVERRLRTLASQASVSS
jgi:hypothetical protein